MTQTPPTPEPNDADQPERPEQPEQPEQPLNAHDSNLVEPRNAGRLQLAVSDWRPVSGKYLVVQIVGSVLFIVVLLAVFLWLALIGEGWAWIPVAAIVVIGVIDLIITPRQVKAIGYQLRDDDLVFRRGIMWQRIVAVPYGRMQLVDITRGPLARALGLAELKLVTAAAATGVSIPGLPNDVAESLRDHLVAVAETRRAGL